MTAQRFISLLSGKFSMYMGAVLLVIAGFAIRQLVASFWSGRKP